MPNIRIKDLSTTATSTAADDFLGIDGATNGTRKMAARTPVFNSVTANTTTDLTLTGGSTGASLVLGQGASSSATVTLPGSGQVLINSAATANDLVVQGTGSTATIAVAKTGGQFARVQVGTAGSGVIYGNGGPFSFNTASSVTGSATEIARFSVTNGNLLIGGTTDITGSGGLKVFGTTAASSTTTGALQVAGGVGVAGKLYIGSTLDMAGAISGANSITSAASTSLVLTGNSGTSLTLPSNAGGGGVATLNHGLYASYSYDGDTAGIRMTNASTGTSAAGALQVANDSGTLGGLYLFSSLHGVTALRNKTSLVASGSIRVFTNSGSSSGQAGTFVVAPGGYNDADVLTVSRTATTSAKPLSVTDTTEATTGGAGALTVSGGIYATKKVITASTLTTAAPTSGTAKEWKLGEVASVSPTSPNRTIRVEIDGTVYFISAKTTND